MRRDLGESSRAHREVIAQITAQIDTEQKQVAHGEREMSLKFVTLGTILNLNRVGGTDFEPSYRQFDEIKAAITQREERIVSLEGEIAAVDKSKLQKGAIVLGSGLLLVIMLLWIVAH
jgi:hypothetical protein